MKIRITPPKCINATIQLPASKSISNRVLIIHALAKATHYPKNLSDCDDTQVMVQALEAKDNETIDINPITLVADYGGKGFTLTIEPEVIP